MRIRILLLALLVHQSWTHPSYSYGSTSEADIPQQSDNPERDGESSKRIIGSSVVTSVSVILNGNEPEFTDALGMKVPKPQLPHLQVASPINLLNPDRYEFYTFDDNGELVKRLMTMQEIQSIVANGDGEGPTIIHSAPINDRDPEKNVQDIVKSVQSVLNREVASNKNSSDVQPILDTPDVSSSWSMILPAIFGNTGGDIFPQNRPQQVVMTPDSDVVESTTKSNKRKPTGKPKPQKKKNGNRRKTTTKRVSTTTPLGADPIEVIEATTRKVFINNHELLQSTETAEQQQEDNLKKRPQGVTRKPASNGTKRPQVNKQKNKTKRPATSTTTTTTPEPITTMPEVTTTTSTSTSTTTTTTTQAPTTVESITSISVTDETVVKEKPPHKKRKKPARKPSTAAPTIDVTTERHFGHYHKRKGTTPRPSVHQKPYPPAEDVYQVPFYHKHKVPSTTATTPVPTTTTTTSAPTTITTTTTDAPTTTTTTTTPAPTTTTTTTTTPAPTTTTPAPTTTTTTTTTTPAPTTTTPVPTTTITTTTPDPTTTTTATTTTPAPTTTPTTVTPAPTTPFTFATYRPTPPTTTPTSSYATYRPPPTTTTPAPSSTSTPSSSYHHSTTTSKPSYGASHLQQQLFEDYGINPEDFAPSLKKPNIPMPGKLSQKEEDMNTKLSFDQILQSLKEESSTEEEMQASESEEVAIPAKLPTNAFPHIDNLEAVTETQPPIYDLPMTMASTNFQTYDDIDELTSRPATHDRTSSSESPESSSSDDVAKDEEVGPLVIITSRPQHHITGKPIALPEVTTPFYEPETKTYRSKDDDEDEDEDATTSHEEQAIISEEESAHVVKFEPLYADVPEPVITTYTTTTTVSPPSTINDDTNEDDGTVMPPTTLPPMESIMQKIDAIISMSLKANGTMEMNNGQVKQSIPHISTMTMKDFKTQAATVASVLEDNNNSQSTETSEMNSSETESEIEFLLSDVINQMTQSQQPTVETTTASNIVTPKPQPPNSSEEDETAHRLSNFAQINPALQISAAALKPSTVRQPTVDESIEAVTSVPLGDDRPQDLEDGVPTTATPQADNESKYVLISQGNDDYSMSVENTPTPSEDDTPSGEEDTTTSQSVEWNTQKIHQTTQRGYVSSEELSKEVSSSEEKQDDITTVKPDSIGDDSTEEDGSEQMIVITSAPDVPQEEKDDKSTEIPGETAVVLSDSDMEDSFEAPELTTVVATLQTGSHLLEGEDPYVKLGEIGAKPTVQSLAQMIYGQNTGAEDQTSSNESAKTEELSEEAEKGKIDEHPAVQEADILQRIEDVDSTEAPQHSKEEDLPAKVELTTAPPVPEETTTIPEIFETSRPSKKPMMNMAQVALEQALLYANRVPIDFHDDLTTTSQPTEEQPTTTEAELPKKIDTTTVAPIVEEKTQKPTSTQAPSSTHPTKKLPNTLKPVSYFNKQSSLIIPDQKFSLFQATQQRPMVRPASLSNLKMPPSSISRPPVKLDPSPVDSLGLEASTVSLDEDLRLFSRLCNELAFTYWRSITSEKISSARSLVISPFALTSMLSMVFLGARGSTSGEMNEVLKLDDMVTFNPHLVFKNITDSVERASDSEIATSAFVREAYSDRANGKILQFFKEKTQQFYSGHVEEVNFHVVNDIIRRRTNLLVKRHTHGKVHEYLRTNSVWVNGPLATISANLFQTDCSRASVNDRDGEMFFQVHPSIRQRRLVPIPAVLFRTGFTAGYEPNLDATVVAFGRVFETVSTIYVMPGKQGPIAPADSLELLEKNLIETAFTKNAWTALLTSLMERPGLEVQLPRFSHRSFVNASIGLQKMGLKGLFKSEIADLRGLTGLAAKDIYLSDMIQINTFSTCGEEKIGEHHHVEMYPAPPIRKRNKDVRENANPEDDSSESVIDFGSIVQDPSMARAFYDDLLDPKFLELPLPLRPRQARIPDAPRLRFDRPFLYFVRHNPTGMVLFMGRFNPRLLP